MSNDNKTLANVRPGGRVRLATVPFDRAHDLLGDAYNAGTHGIGYSQQAMELHDAIIPAQPSPGGQGDAVHCGKCKGRGYVDVDVDVDESGSSIGNIESCPHCALAARQPVGEPVAFMVRWKTEGGFGLEWPKNMQYFHDRADEYEIVPLQRAAPPAQALDLGPSQSVLAEVAQERARQEAKWGQQNHVDWTPTSAATDLAGAWPAGVGDHFKFITDYKAKGAEGHRLGYFDILMEEVAEAHDEARDGNTKATRAELVQVAAVAVAWIECIDRRLALTGSQVVANG
ncbi:hypothetical protein [Stenotrophomonas sepilia]